MHPDQTHTDPRTDDEARDAREEARRARSDFGTLPAGVPVPAEQFLPPHCLSFRVEISAELPTPAADTLTLAREVEYTGHRAETLRIYTAAEPLVRTVLDLLSSTAGADESAEMIGSVTVTVGSPRSRGEVARRETFVITLARELAPAGNSLRPAGTLRAALSAAALRACRSYDLLTEDEFPASPAAPSLS